MKFAFYTLGCKVNQYESTAMQKVVSAAGHTLCSLDDLPDVAVVNSCTVTAESNRKTRQAVRRIRRNSPDAVIVLAGCMPQAFPDEAKALSEADIVMGNARLRNICELVDRFTATGERIFDIAAHERDEKFTTPLIEKYEERTRAYLKIEDGCERFCTYCIIPKARGFVRSKPIDDVRREVSALAGNGYKEIVLVGINLSAYGRDIGCNLCDAVDAAAEIDGIERIRLGSLEPDLFDDDMLDRLARQKKLCPQFHMALQSGCDETLHRMNRHYDTAFYRDLIKRIRSRFENCSITTDVMVGFAGESDEEFEKSLEFVKEIGFARSHVFAYSRREGTPAAAAKNQVAPEVKEARSKRMIALTDESERQFLLSQVGTAAPVLFETCRNGISRGYTPNYTPVEVEGRDLHAKIINVRITGVTDDGCKGEITE